ncbi:MAG: NAD(P)H-dependent oxidoreductase [Tunicatimonas sp.]
MSTLLRIDASARHNESVSRTLADQVQARWVNANPHGQVVTRDLAKEPVAHITETTIRGFYAPVLDAELAAAVQLSDELIEELLKADEVLLSTPMYNFSVPSALKAYVDQIVRINRTFAVVEGQLQGLIPDKRVYIALAEGAAYQGSPMTDYDFLRPYLDRLFRFLGMQQLEFLTIEATTLDEQAMLASRDIAIARINELFTSQTTVS